MCCTSKTRALRKYFRQLLCRSLSVCLPPSRHRLLLPTLLQTPTLTHTYRFSAPEQKCEGLLPPEWRKFSVDPQITSLEVLFSILAKAFELRTDFAISQRELDAGGRETFAAVLSDWDLDAAFLR